MSVILSQSGFDLPAYEPFNDLGESPAEVKQTVFVSGKEDKSVETGVLSCRFTKNKVVRILDMDGGGGREMIPITLLAALERATGGVTGQMYDLIGGASAGGIATLALTLRDPKDPTKPAHSAQWLEQQWPAMAQEVFPAPDPNDWLPIRLWNAAKTALWDLDHAQYSTQNIANVAQRKFHGTLAKDALKPFVIPTLQLCKKAKTRFVTRQDTAQGFFKDISAEKLAELTSAAPTYFNPGYYKRYAWWDGGTFANCTAYAVEVEANRLFGNTAPRVHTSFGTGKTATALDILQDPKAAHWGEIEVLPEIISEILNAEVLEAAGIVRQMYAHKPGFWRWEPNIPNIPLNAASPAVMQQLVSIALTEIRENGDAFNFMVQTMEKSLNDENYAQPIELY